MKPARRPAAVVQEFDASLPASDYIGRVILVPVSLVKLLPGQPRLHFDKGAMDRLRDSIAAIGQQQPVVVIPWDQDESFRLRDGERRWRCCRDLKIPIRVLVVEAKSPDEEFELSTAANLNRESHSPLEKALAMRRLRDGGLKRSPHQIALTFGVTPVTVYNHLKVLDELPQKIIDLMDPNQQGSRQKTLQLTMALCLTALRDYPAEQLRLAQRIVAGGMTMGDAKLAIEAFAEKKQISVGHGRERKPSDYVSLLRSTLKRATEPLNFFRTKSQDDINELFEWVAAARHDEITAQLQAVIDTLLEVQEKMLAAEGVGRRRGGPR